MLLAACTGGDEPGADPTPTPTGTASPDPVELRLAVYGDQTDLQTYQEIAEAFTAEHPHVTFELTSTRDGTAAAEAALGAIGAGVDPPDVFLLDVDHLPDAMAAEAVQPVNELLEEREIPFGDGIQRIGLTAFSADDSLACMPNEVSPLVAYYNKRLVKPRRLLLEDGDRVGPIDRGWTWEAFVAAAEQAVGLGAAVGAKGSYLPPDLGQLTGFILSAGGRIVDDELEPTRLTLSEGATREALRTLAAFTRGPLLSLTTADVERESPLDRFKDGRLGVLFETREVLPSLREATKLRFDVAQIPRIDGSQTSATMNAYCIARTSGHVEEAADFIAFAVDGAGATIAAQTGSMVPVSLDVLHSPEFVQADQPPANVQAFAESARRASVPVYSRHWPAARASAGPALERLLYDPTLDVASEETPELDALLAAVDEGSVSIFDPSAPTESPSP